jgi:ubiquinone biosynthesis protein
MEKVSGVYMSEYVRVAATNPERVKDWLRENNIKAYEAGKRLLLSHYRQLFEENLYHCDLHPGNILLMRENRIALIDFGSVGSTDKSQLMRYFRFQCAFADRDYRKMADLWFLLSPALPNRDLSSAKADIVRLYRDLEQAMSVKAAPYHEKSISMAASGLVKITGDAGVAAAWDCLRQLRAQLTVDSSLAALMPEINFAKVVKEYLRKCRERSAKKLSTVPSMRAQVAKVAENIDVPTKLGENAYFEGEYLRRRALKYEGYVSKAAQIVKGIFSAIAQGFLLAAVTLVLLGLHQRYHILHRLQTTALGPWMKRIPDVAPSIWMIAAFAAVYISREFVAIKQVLEQPDAPKVGGSRR